MANFYKLRNHIKHYAWGSAELIPRLLGVAGDGAPWAELWMDSIPEPCGELPFLFKLLAAEKPLSIQAHPNKAQAREGFARENSAGLPHDDPGRNYRDPNHKPEIICALTPFVGMCGFRSPGEIVRAIAPLLSALQAAPLRESLSPLLHALEMPDTAIALRNFLNALFNLSPSAREALTQCILSTQGEGEEWELMRQFARQYPNDPAIIAPLYLNVFHLAPGEAVFIDAGILHAYIHGFGVELMANSDNVLRGGLTSKHVDVPELMRALNFTPMQPRVIKPEPDSGCFTYPAPCEEFSLTVMRGKADGTAQAIALPRNAPAICIVTEGEVSVAAPGAPDTVLKQGEAAFIPAVGDEQPLILRGEYTLYAASIPGRNVRL